MEREAKGILDDDQGQLVISRANHRRQALPPLARTVHTAHGMPATRPTLNSQLSTFNQAQFPQPSTTSNSAFSPLWSGQNPTGCKESPAARLTQELATCL